MDGKDREKLDVKDRKILYQLDLDSRQPVSLTAKKVGLSKQAADYRIKQLLKKGVISGFYTVTSSAKLGYTQYKIYLRLGSISAEEEKELIDYLVKHPKTIFVVSIIGKYDLIIGIAARNPQEFRKYLEEIQKKYGKYFMAFDVITNIEVYEFNKEYLDPKPGRRKMFTIIGKPAKEELDELGYRILEQLAYDVRKSNREIAKALKISPETARQRIKEMIETGVIESFRYWFNHEKVPWVWYKIALHLKEMSEETERKIISYCRGDPRILCYLHCIGPWDADLELEVTDVVELNEILRDFRRQFKDVIKDYDPLLLYRTYKYGYIPLRA
ncbi:MAG: Lrp/AsnC family transcriptional regulator [Candidatus Micrarchaeota archaeon]